MQFTSYMDELRHFKMLFERLMSNWETWLVHVCAVTPSYVWRDSFICDMWFNHVCQKMIFERLLSYTETWLVRVCDITWFVCATCLDLYMTPYCKWDHCSRRAESDDEKWLVYLGQNMTLFLRVRHYFGGNLTRVCGLVCVWLCICVYVCVYVCVRERERERKNIEHNQSYVEIWLAHMGIVTWFVCVTRITVGEHTECWATLRHDSYVWHALL